MDRDIIEIFIVILFYLLLFINAPLTIILHEFGHAIPALILTKGKVSIYIGSYGDKNDSFSFKIGLLKIWFKNNIMKWSYGCTVFEAKSVSTNKEIIITLGGPFVTVLQIGLLWQLIFAYKFQGEIKLALFICLFTSILNIILIIINYKKGIKCEDGLVIYNDANLLKRLITIKINQIFGYEADKSLENIHTISSQKEYTIALELFNNRHYLESSFKFEKLLAAGHKDNCIYHGLILAHLKLKNYQKVNELVDSFMALGNLDSDDYAMVGIASSHQQLLDKAMIYYNKALDLNPYNLHSLINKGFLLNLLEKFNEAIVIFDRLIEIPESQYISYIYANRGLSKLQLDNIKEGLEDMKSAFIINENESYIFRGLGLYYFKIKEYKEALKQFRTAKKLDSETYEIDTLITSAVLVIEK